MKKAFLIWLIFSLVFLVASCQGTTQDTDGSDTTESIDTTVSTEAEQPESLFLALADYHLVHPDGLRGNLWDATKTLSSLAEKAGFTLEQGLDSETEVSEKEILVGLTNRPESREACELMGDNDYIVAVVNQKLVIYAKEDKGYVFAMHYLANQMKEGEFAVKKDLFYSSPIVTKKVFDSVFSSGQTLTFSVTLSHVNTKLTLFFGKENTDAVKGYEGYAVDLSKSGIVFSKWGKEEATVMAEKNLAIRPERAYDVTVAFDSDYCTFYFHDDAEGIEPWPEFDLKVGSFESFTLGMIEESGYGATVEKLCVTPTENKVSGGTVYTNPIISSHADPDILYHNGVYYLYATSRGYDVYTSLDLVNWEYKGKSLPGGGWGVDNQYWAPDVEEIGGKFYMAVSFGEEGFGMAVAESPLGPFVCQGEAPLLKKTIDGHIFVDDDGKVYLYYTSWYEGRSYGIYGVELGEDLVTPKWGTEKKVISPTKAWEKNMGDVVEAPYMLKKDGLYYLVYSGSHTESPSYAVGYATARSPLGPFSKSADSPILNKTSDVHGPAHCSVVPAPDGSLVIVYHCHNTLTSVHPRNTCIDKIRFAPTEGGKWRLEVWGPTSREKEADWLN